MALRQLSEKEAGRVEETYAKAKEFMGQKYMTKKQKERAERVKIAAESARKRHEEDYWNKMILGNKE